MKHTIFSILAVAALALPTTAMAKHGHGHHGSMSPGAHQCDSKVACPLGHKDCTNHKDCPTGKHDCTAGMDSDKDGKVSLEEFTAAHNARMKERFNRLDVNGDGFVTDADSKARKAKYLDRFFADADSDKDGKLSKEEFLAAKHGHRQGKKECPLSKKK